VSNADLAAQQAKLNSIKDQIAQEKQTLDSIHAQTLTTNPDFSDTSNDGSSMTNDQVDKLTAQVLSLPDLQAQDDATEQATCAAKAAGAGGASGGSGGGATGTNGGGAAAPAGGGSTPAGGSSNSNSNGGATDRADGSTPTTADIMKKHQEFATLIKHAQQDLNEINVMPFLGQNSDSQAAALTCGTDTPTGGSDAGSTAAGGSAGATASATAATAATAAATTAASPASATAATGSAGAGSTA
jgi:hypothetical protein